MKTCNKCHQEKEESEFYIYDKKTQKTINTCKKCHGKIMTKWQKDHPQKCKEIWIRHNIKRSKGRICGHCGKNYKIATAQNGCSIVCRFYLSFIKKESGCWEWIRYKSGRRTTHAGYAAMWINGVNKRASHVSYELHKGPVAIDLMVLHTCDNPGCVNPDHLYLGTHQQNMDDMNGRGRGNSGRLHFRKYSREKVCKVISLRKEGKIFREISKLTGVKESACKYICKHPERVS